MRVRQFTYMHSSAIPEFWLEAAKKVCQQMQALNLDDELVIQDRQIWAEVERVCSLLGYDAHYWPENLIILPVDSGGN